MQIIFATKGMILDEHSRRPRIPITEIGPLIGSLRELQVVIVANPEYAKRRPQQVLEQIILKLKDAQAAQRRAYPKGKNSN